MEDSSDGPPTSAVLLENFQFSQVIFNNVEKFYVPGGDVTCYYTLTQNITPRGKDWVGIFRVGWKTTREYFTFLWAPVPARARRGTAVQQQVQFKAYYLPKDDEYYQFCYVDQDGLVRGASVPFQFRAEAEDDILVVTTQGEVEEIERRNKNLSKENEELKASCANLQKQNVELQEELKKTQELQKSLESLRSSTEKLELELNSLQVENKHLKEQGDCREAEVHQLKEQIQTVTSDKEHLEKRLKAALDDMNQLQKLREENDALLRLLSQPGDVPPPSAVSQGQAPVPAPGAAGLLFGNPYSAAGGDPGAGVGASLRKCPVCGEVFPGQDETREYEVHVQNHLLLKCPICGERFEECNRQVFDDHLLCHSLE